MMDLNEFAKEVHANAVAHGFWGEEYTDAAVIALIHAEISEAFEEWRAGRPMVWHECVLDLMCDGNGCSDGFDPNDECKYRNPKPEGIAVELIDVVLRVLDAAAAWGIEIIDSDIKGSAEKGLQVHVDALDLPEFITGLHFSISMAIENESAYTRGNWVCAILSAVFAWLRAQNLDPEALMLEKHEYNKSRPYRHGGKRV